MLKRFSRWLDNKTHLALTIIFPSLLLIAVFVYLPALYSLRFSFMQYNIKMPGRVRFNGLENYGAVLQDPVFLAAARRGLYSMVLATLLVLGISLIFAQVLNQRFRFRALLRAVIIVPWAIPPVVSGHLWKWIFNGEYGVFNGLLYQLGIIGEYQFWLANPGVALHIADRKSTRLNSSHGSLS